MHRARGPQKRSIVRRDQILEAALLCFVEVGYVQTTVEEIRRRTGASTGSLYHHFADKEDLAAAVYLHAISSYQSGLLAELERRRGAEAGIRGLVRYHLRWVADHPEAARYLVEMRHFESIAAVEGKIAAENRSFSARSEAWFQPRMASGELRRLPPDVLLTLLIGPAQEYARLWLAGRARTGMSTAIEHLADAAWESVRGPAATAPASRKARTKDPTPTERGGVR